MKLPFALKQKQVGILLILLGGFLFAFIFAFLYFKVIRIAGFANLLPSKETVGLVEFPAALEPGLEEKLSAFIGMDWNRDVVPWASQKAAVAFLKKPGAGPVLLVQTRSVEAAFSSLKNLNNPGGELKENKIAGMAAFSTPQLNFAFLSDVVAVALTRENLTALLAAQSSLAAHLGSDPDFKRIRRNAPGAYFMYAKPREIPAPVYAALAPLVSSMPRMVTAFSALGIGAGKITAPRYGGPAWKGKTYAILGKNIPSAVALAKADQAYRGLLLTAVPADVDWLISGQNLWTQMKKTDALLDALGSAAGSAGRPALPKLSAVIGRFTEEYLPGVDAEKDLASLVQGEFVLAASSDRVLFIAQAPDQNARGKTDALAAAFEKTSGRLTPRLKDVTLPDGTSAQELVADPSRVKRFEETVSGVRIRGFLLGKNGAVYDALTAGKWLVSNDFDMIKKAVLLAQEPGPGFRESALYRQSLQPILKNPELFGVVQLPQLLGTAGVFSFSKRLSADHMEADFMLR